MTRRAEILTAEERRKKQELMRMIEDTIRSGDVADVPEKRIVRNFLQTRDVMLTLLEHAESRGSTEQSDANQTDTKGR